MDSYKQKSRGNLERFATARFSIDRFLVADKPLLRILLPPPIVHKKNCALHFNVLFIFVYSVAAKKNTVNKKV
jgi:hypothetical protein